MLTENEIKRFINAKSNGGGNPYHDELGRFAEGPSGAFGEFAKKPQMEDIALRVFGFGSESSGEEKIVSSIPKKDVQASFQTAFAMHEIQEQIRKRKHTLTFYPKNISAKEFLNSPESRLALIKSLAWDVEVAAEDIYHASIASISKLEKIKKPDSYSIIKDHEKFISDMRRDYKEDAKKKIYLSSKYVDFFERANTVLTDFEKDAIKAIHAGNNTLSYILKNNDKNMLKEYTNDNFKLKDLM